MLPTHCLLLMATLLEIGIDFFARPQVVRDNSVNVREVEGGVFEQNLFGSTAAVEGVDDCL
jgi:hypothetical protein